MIRSVKLSLKFATPTKLAKIVAVLDRYRATVNAYVRTLWTDSGGLDKETAARVPCGHLLNRQRAHALQQAIGIITATRRSAKALHVEPSMPIFRGSMILSKQLAQLTSARTAGPYDLWLRFSTLSPGNRIDIPLKATRSYRKWTGLPLTTLKGGCGIGGKPGRYYVIVWVNLPELALRTEGGTLGIDVGINKLLATSDGKKYGDNIKRYIAVVRRCKLGSKGKKRARIARDRYINWVLNQLPWEKLKLVAVEKLTNLKKGKKPNRGKSFRKAVAPWTYAYVLRRIEMKAQENRVLRVEVNPAYSSQTCPSCTHRAALSRSNEKFRCVRCGYAADADIVGSLNILNRATGECIVPQPLTP